MGKYYRENCKTCKELIENYDESKANQHYVATSHHNWKRKKKDWFA